MHIFMTVPVFPQILMKKYQLTEILFFISSRTSKLIRTRMALKKRLLIRVLTTSFEVDNVYITL